MLGCLTADNVSTLRRYWLRQQLLHGIGASLEGITHRYGWPGACLLHMLTGRPWARSPFATCRSQKQAAARESILRSQQCATRHQPRQSQGSDTINLAPTHSEQASTSAGTAGTGAATVNWPHKHKLTAHSHTHTQPGKTYTPSARQLPVLDLKMLWIASQATYVHVLLLCSPCTGACLAQRQLS